MSAHHPAIAVELSLLQLLVAIKSNSLRTELNYAFVVNDASVLEKSPGWIPTHYDVHTLHCFLSHVRRLSCGILDAIVSGLLLQVLLSTAARRVGKGTAMAVGVMALATTAADLVFLSAVGTSLNTGVLALYPRIFWMSRFVVAQQIMGGKRVLGWLWRAALTTLLLGIAHLALVCCVHRACTTDRWPRRLAVAGLLLRILLLPLHPVDESPSLALRVCADMLLVAFDGSTGEDATVASSQEHVQHRRPTLERLPRLVAAAGTHASEQPTGTENGGPIGVVLLILESVRADAVSPLYAPPAAGTRPTAPFLSSLAAQPGTFSSQAHLATMPNTNKAVLELLCGLTPRIATSWDELDASFVKTFREECLPRRLSADAGWRTMIGNPTNSPRGTMQYALGPDETLGTNELWAACHERVLKRRPWCVRHIAITWSKQCIAELNVLRQQRGHRLRDNSGGGDNEGSEGEAWYLASKLFRKGLARAMRGEHRRRPGLWARMGMRNVTNACGRITVGPGALTPGQITPCLKARCLTRSAPSIFDGQKGTALLNKDDFLLRDGTLKFAASSLERGQSFFAALLTTGAHNPYRPPPPSGLLDATRSPASDYRHYLDRVRDADALARTLYDDLSALSSRVLFVVVGDHGEAFGEGGHYQHGSCVRAGCIRVPLLIAVPRGTWQLHPPLHQRMQQQPPTGWFDRDAALGESGTVAWFDSLSRHADVFETIVHWSGHRLSNSSAHRTSLRRGRSFFTPRRGGSAGRCVEAYAFFNPAMRAIACAASHHPQHHQEPQLQTQQQQQQQQQQPEEQEGGEAVQKVEEQRHQHRRREHTFRFVHLLLEPQRTSTAQQVVFRVNASAATGLVVEPDSRSSALAEASEESRKLRRLKTIRLSVNNEYDTWRRPARGRS